MGTVLFPVPLVMKWRKIGPSPILFEEALESAPDFFGLGEALFIETFPLQFLEVFIDFDRAPVVFVAQDNIVPEQGGRMSLERLSAQCQGD
jgi:hypothetical protein